MQRMADYLVMKGVPFRDAHGIIGRLVLYCIEKNTCIDALSLEELKAISPVFEDDIYDAVSLKTCVEETYHRSTGTGCDERSY